MTREEAIEWLKDMENITENWSQDVALSMAIEALKQVTGKLKKPCDSLLTDDNDDSKEQKSKLDGDLISRADAIEAVKDAYEMDAIYKVISEDIINALSALPSADAVEVVQCEDCIFWNTEEE